MRVLLERRQGGGYRASAPPLGESVEAATREEALSGLRDRIVARLVGDSEWVELDIPLPGGTPNTEENRERNWRRVAGMFKDDPTFDEFLAIIEENRRIENEAEGIYPERNPEPMPAK
jgi:hypothetical protein